MAITTKPPDNGLSALHPAQGGRAGGRLSGPVTVVTVAAVVVAPGAAGDAPPPDRSSDYLQPTDQATAPHSGTQPV